jgi:hypothetical protein
MAAIALSIGDIPTNPLGRPGGGLLLTQAQALLASTLEAVLAPAARQEHRLFASALLAASTTLAERASQAGLPAAKSLLGFLRAAPALAGRADELAERLAGILPTTAAEPSVAPVFLQAISSSAGGTPQENVGRVLLADARHQAQSGLSQFTLRVGAAQDYVLNIILDPRDTNRDVLRKVAAAINRAQPDVRAEVQEASAGGAGAVRLRITALRPGVAQQFELRDRVGNVVAYTRANDVRTPPSDAQTGGVASITAVAAPSPTPLSAETRATAVGLVRQVVETFNELIGQAEGMPLREDLMRGLIGAAAEGVAPLATAGLALMADGRLRLEDFVLEAALTDRARMPAAIAGLQGLAARLAQAARAALAEPPLALVEPPERVDDRGMAPPMPTPMAPVASLLRSYRLAQQRVDLPLVTALRFGGLIVNLPA